MTGILSFLILKGSIILNALPELISGNTLIGALAGAATTVLALLKVILAYFHKDKELELSREDKLFERLERRVDSLQKENTRLYENLISSQETIRMLQDAVTKHKEEMLRLTHELSKEVQQLKLIRIG